MSFNRAWGSRALLLRPMVSSQSLVPGWVWPITFLVNPGCQVSPGYFQVSGSRKLMRELRTKNNRSNPDRSASSKVAVLLRNIFIPNLRWFVNVTVAIEHRKVFGSAFCAVSHGFLRLNLLHYLRELGATIRDSFLRLGNHAIAAPPPPGVCHTPLV